MFFVAIPALASEPAEYPVSQSVFTTGLAPETAAESAGVTIEDTTAIMNDGIFDQARRVQYSKRKYDILAFHLNMDAQQLPNLSFRVYLNALYGGNPQTVKVYAYNVDGNSVQTSVILSRTLSVGWNSIDVSQILPLMNGYGFVKFRIVAVQNWIDISEVRFFVINHAPIAVINGPYVGVATDSVAFRSDGTQDPDGDVITYFWNFGDGNTSNEANPLHVYAEKGKYTVTLTVTDPAGAISFETTDTEVQNETFETIRPTAAYNPEGWSAPSNGFDWNLGTCAYRNSINAVPSISFGGSLASESINAWQPKTQYWHAAWLYVSFDGAAAGSMDDLMEIVVADRNGNLKHTVLPSTVGTTTRELVQRLNMTDWGDGFSNIADLRVRVNGYRKKGADGAQARVYDVRIDGDTAPQTKDYSRGNYSLLPGNDNNLMNNYTPAEINAVEADNGERVTQADSMNQYTIHQFKEKTPSHAVAMLWNGQIHQGGAEAYAQSFKANTSGYLTRTGIFLKKGGSPNGYLLVRLKSEPGGEVLAESGQISETSIPVSGGWKTFAFSNPALVSAGNIYYFELWRDKSDAISYPEIVLRYCSGPEHSLLYRSHGNWIEAESNAILYDVYIDNVLDDNSHSCYILDYADRGIQGLDWKNIYLEAYNRTTSSWTQLDSAVYDGSVDDINLSAMLFSDDYFDNSNWLTARVSSFSDSFNSLATDSIVFYTAGTIAVNPATLNFGSVAIDSFSTQNITVANTGAGNLSIGTITAPSAPFAVAADGCSGQTLTPATSCSIVLRFSPNAAGTFTAMIAIPSDDLQHPNINVALNGTGVLPVLTVAITSPPDGGVFTATPIEVSGTMTNNAGVTVNGLQATVNNNTFSASVPLLEGQNTITATATDQYSQTASHSIHVTLVTKGIISGRITDASTWAPISSANVSVTDSLDNLFTTATDNNGMYSLNGVAPGAFSGTVSKEGYNSHTFSGTISAGQTFVHDAGLSRVVPAISNIAISSITRDSATITWTTDQPADSVIDYGLTSSYGSSVNDSVLATAHSMTLTDLTPGTTYHYRITSTNVYGFSSSSEDNSFATKTFMATTLGDYGNVTVMEAIGDYDAKNPDGSLNAMPRQEISKEFLRTHPDEYDFLIIFSNFDFPMPDASAQAFYLEVKNDVQGIGKQLFDNSVLFGSNGKLQGTIDMGNVISHATNPADPNFEKTVITVSHELMHRWGAAVRFLDTNQTVSTALLGKDGTHWSFLLDSDGSVLYGNDWKDNGDGTFTSMTANKYYSPLDLYLMGMIDASRVSPMLLIENQAIDPARMPEIGATISGTARAIAISDIIAAEGERIPNASASQKSFKTAFLLITRPGTFDGNILPGMENVRNAWAGNFSSLTYGEGTIEGVAPSLTVAISFPSDGATITSPYVTVKGAIINSTGNETGVTVNGIVATVYNNQFIAGHVPLTEGSNTITVTATDTDGNTATTSITVNAVTTGHYVRLTSNIESGIAPLEVTLRIDGSFSIKESSLNITGPVQPEIISSSPDEYTVKMTIDGIYYLTVNVTGPDSNVYQDTIAVTMMNRAQLDNLLKAKWEGMRTALASQDVEEALTYYSEETKLIYNDLFNALYSYLPQIAQEMQGIQLIYAKNNTAKYRMRQDELYGGRNITLTYYIYFVIDRDGVWKIYRY